MVAFQLGDKVRFKKEYKEYLGKRWQEGVAKIIDEQKNMSNKQYCRITFDSRGSIEHMLVKYEDVGAWMIERVEE
jgi:hypothetical protein